MTLEAITRSSKRTRMTIERVPRRHDIKLRLVVGCVLSLAAVALGLRAAHGLLDACFEFCTCMASGLRQLSGL
jgi:hypothetical protein